MKQTLINKIVKLLKTGEFYLDLLKPASGRLHIFYDKKTDDFIEEYWHEDPQFHDFDLRYRQAVTRRLLYKRLNTFRIMSMIKKRPRRRK